MINIPKARLRLVGDASNPEPTNPTNAINRRRADFATGNALRVELGAFDRVPTHGLDRVVDIQNIASMLLEVKPMNADGSRPDQSVTPEMSRTVLNAAMDNTLDAASWLDESKQTAIFDFTDAETANAPAGRKLLTISGLTNDPQPATVNFLVIEIDCYEDGGPSVSPAPPPGLGQNSGLGHTYLFDASSTVEGDPGAGYIRANHADLTMATAFYISNTTAQNQTVGSYFANLKTDATHYIQRLNGGQNVGSWLLSEDATQQTGYVKFVLNPQSILGSLSQDEEVVILAQSSAASGGGGQSNVLESRGAGESHVLPKEGSILPVKSHLGTNGVKVSSGPNELNYLLDEVAAWEILANNSAGTASPSGVLISTLTLLANPGGGDLILGGTTSGALRRIDINSFILDGQNIGSAGIDVLKGKNGTNIEAYRLYSADSIINIAINGAEDRIDLTLPTNSIPLNRLSEADSLSIVGNPTESGAAPIYMTAAQAKTILDYALGEMSDVDLITAPAAISDPTARVLAYISGPNVWRWIDWTPPSGGGGLTPINAWSFLANNTAGSAIPTGVAILELTELTTPVAGDWAVGGTSTGELRRINLSHLLGGGGLPNIAAWSILLNNTGSTAAPSGVVIPDLAPDTSDLDTSFILASLAGGDLRSLSYGRVMFKSAYDSNDDGKVDAADNADNATNATNATNASNVPWGGVSGTPTTLSGYGITDAVQSPVETGDISDGQVTDAKLDDMPGNTLKMNNTGGAAAPQNVAINSVVQDESPAGTTRILAQTAGGGFVSVAFDDIPGSGGGGIQSFNYRFNSSTSAADPGSGKFAYNNGNPLLATECYVNKADENNDQRGNLLMALGAGDQVGYDERTNASEYDLFNVTGDAIDNGTWVTIPVAYDNGSGTLPSNNTRCTLYLLYGGNLTLDNIGGTLALGKIETAPGIRWLQTNGGGTQEYVDSAQMQTSLGYLTPSNNATLTNKTISHLQNTILDEPVTYPINFYGDVSDRTYTLILQWTLVLQPLKIDNLIIQSGAGTATGSLEIDGTPIVGMSGMSISTTLTNYAPSSNTELSAGQKLTLTITGGASLADLSGVLETTLAPSP